VEASLGRRTLAVIVLMGRPGSQNRTCAARKSILGGRPCAVLIDPWGELRLYLAAPPVVGARANFGEASGPVSGRGLCLR